jgi:hypothetical protein
LATSAAPSARALSALSHLANLGSLTAAAEQLGVTRSALSHRIAELEKGLGVPLVRIGWSRRRSHSATRGALACSLHDCLTMTGFAGILASF